MTLMREMIELWNCFAIGRIAGWSTPSIRYFTCTASSCVSMWMSLAPLDGGVDGRVDETDDRAEVARQPLDGEALLAVVFFLQQLQVEALRGVFQHALRVLALLQNRLDLGPRADHHLDRGVEQDAELVDHRQVARVGDDDLERLADAAVRHEVVAEHQVRWNRPEQLLVDPERLHVDELEAVALGETARQFHLGPVLVGGDRRAEVRRGRVQVRVRCRCHKEPTRARS